MKDNALSIILFMYCVSSSVAAWDVLVAAPMGVEFTGWNGEPLGPQFRQISERMAEHDMAGKLAELDGSLDAGHYIERAYVSFELGFDMMMQMLKLLTAVYAFEILGALGIPQPFIAIMVFMYGVLVAYSIMRYAPAISKTVTTILTLIKH